MSKNERRAQRAQAAVESAARAEVPRSERKNVRHEVVGSWALREVGRRPVLPSYIAQLWGRRHFIWSDARTRAYSSNRNMVLGNAWLVLLPMLDGLFYYAIFGLLLDFSRGMDNYVAFLLIGIFMFQYTTRVLNGGAAAITSNRNMIRAFTFPRAALPLAVVLREALSMIPVMVTMVVLLLVIPPGVEVTRSWLLFPVIFVFQACFNFGMALIAARLTARVPDLKNLISVFSRFWRYGSAVMFPFDRFVTGHPQLVAVLELNPLFVIIDVYRSILMDGEVPGTRSLVLLVAWSLGTLLVGFVFFWRAEERYGRE